MLNRRLFVATASSAAAMLASTKAAAFANTATNTAQNVSGHAWDQAGFQQLQGDYVFLKNAEGQVVEAQLSSVADIGSQAELEQFTVEFSAREALAEGIYQLSHRTAGRCQLFLSGSDKRCTALFSLLR